MNQLFERLSSPISGTFFASFMLWNWPLFFLFFDSKLSFAEKVSIVSHMSNPWTFFVLPLVSGAIYLFGMPWLLTKLKIFHDKIDRMNILQTHKNNAIIENEKIFGSITPLEINKACIDSVRKNLENLNKVRDNLDTLKKQYDKNSSIYRGLEAIEQVQQGIINKLEIDIANNKEIYQIIKLHKEVGSYGFESLKNALLTSLAKIQIFKQSKNLKG